MIVYARMMSGKVFTFELDVSTFIYKVKKLRYMLSRELRQLPQNIKIYKDSSSRRVNPASCEESFSEGKDEDVVDDSELLLEEEYCVFVDI